MMRRLREDIAELFYEMQLKNRDYLRLQDPLALSIARLPNGGNHRKAKPIPYYLTPKAYEALLNRKAG